MNQRIRELAEQCNGFLRDEDGARAETHVLVGKDIEKFAELIIRRVIDRIEDWAEDDFGLNALAIEILDEFDMELKDEQ